jgi:hypothetical protein
MKVFRGPSSTDSLDSSHELVSEVDANQLTECVSSKARIRFNITKDGADRRAVCTAELDDADILALFEGVLARFRGMQECLASISRILSKHELGFEQQIYAIEKIIAPFRLPRDA